MGEFVKSIRKLAERIGVTHPALLRAVDEGRIPPFDGVGPYDVELYRRALNENSRRTRPRSGDVAGDEVLEHAAAGDEDLVDQGAAGDEVLEPTAAKAIAWDKGAERVEVPAEATAAIVATLRAAGTEIVGQPTMRDAATALEILKGLKARLEVDRLQGLSTDRARAHEVLTSFTRTLRNSLFAWVRRIAPLVAREMGIPDHDALQALLERYLRETLEAIARVPPAEDLLPPEPGGAK